MVFDLSFILFQANGFYTAAVDYVHSWQRYT